MRALVVDDSGPMRAIVIRNLRTVGIEEIVQAADGAEALKLFRTSVFDVVITDFNMPQMNGLELVKKLRASGSEVPILMLTTEAERSTVLAAIQAGVTGYLIKPFDSSLLQKKLEKVLAGIPRESAATR
ncbi:MAG: response regulator [Planctomycetota bacterium]|nr:response regulator [Planctomycetota bacterium]